MDVTHRQHAGHNLREPTGMEQKAYQSEDADVFVLAPGVVGHDVESNGCRRSPECGDRGAWNSYSVKDEMELRESSVWSRRSGPV